MYNVYVYFLFFFFSAIVRLEIIDSATFLYKFKLNDTSGIWKNSPTSRIIN